MLTLVPGVARPTTRVSDEPVASCGLRRRLDCLEVDPASLPRIEVLLPEAEAEAFAARVRERARPAGKRPRHNLVEVVRDEERSGWAVVGVLADRAALPAVLAAYGELLAAA